jgi:hypothetical protein
MNRPGIVALAATLIVGLGGVSAASYAGADCVPAPAYTETIDHPAVTHDEVVHHDAVTHIVHHDAVPAGPDLWWNWSPNHEQGPFDGPPAFPLDERGTWQGPHENGGPDQDTYGTFNSSNSDNGRGSWFHREHGTPAVDAYDEVVVDQEAYDETVTVVDVEAYTETIEHPAVTCDSPKPKPPVVVPVVQHHKPKPNKPSLQATTPVVIDAGL